MAYLTTSAREIDHAYRASSSFPGCSGSSSYPRYDVFINHRGPDVKDTFAKYLYDRLLQHDLRVFLDKHELLHGHDLTSQIKAAIRGASVHVAIFSPNYAESNWCLDELVLMLKSGNTIIPVFYNVMPSELQCTGKVKDANYAEALRNHEQKKTYDSQNGKEKPRYDSSTIQNWRNAFSSVADIRGFELEACNGDEEELLEKVVQSVRKRVPKTPLFVAKYPTGLAEKFEDFEKTVLSQQEESVEVKVVGIVGVRGVGKTTLAKEFFNRERSNYNESSFILTVRAGRMSLNSLQSDLIYDLKNINIKIESSEDGVGILKKNLSSCHALIILDDVDHVDQLNAFLPVKYVLHPKSLILVTSRDKHVLRIAGIVESSIYHLTGLNKSHSQEFFCSHAFFRRYPPPDFKDLVDGFLTACDGLPLSLKESGDFLCGENDKSYWEEQLSGLVTSPNTADSQ